MSTKAIEQFLQTAYTDERLAMLLAHCEDGKLSFGSCCCLIGIPTANHSLQGFRDGVWTEPHLEAARESRLAIQAEKEFDNLSPHKRGDHGDVARREQLIPLIRAEMARRETVTVPERETEFSDCTVKEYLSASPERLQVKSS